MTARDQGGEAGDGLEGAIRAVLTRHWRNMTDNGGPTGQAVTDIAAAARHALAPAAVQPQAETGPAASAAAVSRPRRKPAERGNTGTRRQAGKAAAERPE